MTSHAMVAHRWAQDDANARNVKGFNMYYERSEGRRENIIFSYGSHFPAAAFVDDAHGERVVLVTTRSYSTSTAKHMSHIRRAIPSRYTVFHVPHVSALYKPGGSADFHPANLEAYISEIAGLAAKAKRARVNGPWLLSQARARLEEARAYAAAFKLKAKVPDDLEEIAGAWAKMTAAKAKAEAKAKKDAEKRAREAAEQAKMRDADAFARWQAGQGHSAPYSYRTQADGTVYLRRVGDELQTSQNATVPWSHAVKAFRFIKLCRERGEGFQTNGRVIRVGHFTVDSITPQGDMIAGCHRFAWSEIERLARAEGVFDLPADAGAVETRQHA